MGAGNSERRGRRRGDAPRDLSDSSQADSRQADARQTGATLVEILISVVLVGLIGTTMATAVLTTVVTSGFQDRQAIADSELRRYADYVRSRSYVACADDDPTTGPYRFIVGTQTPPNVTGRVVPGSVKFWSNRSASGLGTAPTFVEREHATSPCRTGATLADPALQEVTLEVTVAGSPVVTKQVTIIKRNPLDRNSG